MTDLERQLEEALEHGVLDQGLIDLQDARNAERFQELFRDAGNHVEVTDGRRTIGVDDVLRPF